MSSDHAAPAIHAENLSKCYQIYERPADRLKQMLLRGRRRYYREFWALRHVSFSIRPGEVLGVVGRNGAGKSTLLQLICGTMQPTGGRIAVNGRIAALLELGAGFNPEFTGRENVFMSAAIMGLDRRETEARLAEIFEFAGIGDFVDQPVKTYSSGMFVRLAFSAAIHVNPDILLVDEALAVGDVIFQHQCISRIREMQADGTTIIFVSHDMAMVRSICTDWPRAAPTIVAQAAVAMASVRSGRIGGSFLSRIARYVLARASRAAPCSTSILRCIVLARWVFRYTSSGSSSSARRV